MSTVKMFMYTHIWYVYTQYTYTLTRAHTNTHTHPPTHTHPNSDPRSNSHPHPHSHPRNNGVIIRENNARHIGYDEAVEKTSCPT